MSPRYYAIKLYPYAGFPKFWDSYKTLTQAREVARRNLGDHFHTAEIMRDAPKKPGYFGIERDVIETLTNGKI